MTQSPLDQSNSQQVQEMFRRIAPRYDLFNTVATLGRDGAWRRQATKSAAPGGVVDALDAATGAGKLAMELLTRADRVTAFDFADRMVALAQKRLEPHGSRARTLLADAMAMPFADGSFDCATIGFGLRNVKEPKGCLEEFLRVLKPGGRLVVLDISRPAGGAHLLIYQAAFKLLFPLVGWALSGHQAAYQYLPASVDAFLSPFALARLLECAGFTGVTYQVLHFSTITIHVGVKPL
jgi:demethylmenaquinone methyltransferase/2-methoxy-6-polyprenyl-1,4-benzoquinol methylase|tara:strand:- start:81 stop:791 length:711 start_codon:yes stop_codon:yes gene_type:complete